MRFNLHHSTRHLLKERGGCGDRELQNPRENKALLHYFNTGKQEAKASFIATSLPAGPTSELCRRGGSSPSTTSPVAGSYSYTARQGCNSRCFFQSRMPVKIKKLCLCWQTERARGFAEMESTKHRPHTNPIGADVIMDPAPAFKATRSSIPGTQRLDAGPEILGCVTALKPSEGSRVTKFS